MLQRRYNQNVRSQTKERLFLVVGGGGKRGLQDSFREYLSSDWILKVGENFELFLIFCVY